MVFSSLLGGIRARKDFPWLGNAETARLENSVLLAVTVEGSIVVGGRPVKFTRAQVSF